MSRETPLVPHPRRGATADGRRGGAGAVARTAAASGRGLTVAAWALLTVAACDTSITNPGPVQDESLDDPASHAALVNGISRSLSNALNYVAFTGAAVTREVAWSGGLNLFAFTQLQREGKLTSGYSETDDHWKFAQQARWVAEDGVRRLRAALGEDFSSSRFAARALLYVGYANRLLGENMCEAVIDGGPRQPRTVSLERAEAAFSEALAVAEAADEPEVALAARAGRAAVRVHLNDWAGAVADAQAVPRDFVFNAVYSTEEEAHYNRIFWANGGQPHRAHTVWSTFYETYFVESGDPRTPWAKNPALPVGPSLPPTPWYFQTKYDNRSDPIRLSSGREMQLILAEARLLNGDWQGALDLLNELRADVDVEPWTATSLEEAWTALKRERGIELWLEGRRLGDVRRWSEDGTPGAIEDLTGRDTCFPVGQTEIDTNTNFSFR